MKRLFILVAAACLTATSAFATDLGSLTKKVDTAKAMAELTKMLAEATGKKVSAEDGAGDGKAAVLTKILQGKKDGPTIIAALKDAGMGVVEGPDAIKLTK